jgi:hypothetical protein
MVDNTLILMQYAKGGGQVEDEQLRTMLGIGECADWGTGLMSRRDLG